MMEEKLKDVFLNVNDWLKFAESKNGALLALDSGLIFGVMQSLDVFSPPSFFYLAANVYVISLVACLGYSGIICLKSFFPVFEIGHADADVPGECLIFYADIAGFGKDWKSYLDKIYISNQLDPLSEYSDYSKYYARQIIANSTITVKKFELFKKAVWWTMAAFVTPPILYAIKYFKKGQ